MSAYSGRATRPANDANTNTFPSWLLQGRWKTAFWKTATLLSLAINMVLLIVLLSVARLLFDIKTQIASPLLDTLYTSFVQMDQAHIRTTILVEDSVPIRFTLPVQTDTTVRLTQDTFIPNVPISLNTGGVSINAPADIVLPAGTPLNINLNIQVPVEQEVPIQLPVVVDIPLRQTELHEPFYNLQMLIQPYKDLLDATPSSWKDVWCGIEWLCPFAQ